MAALVALDVVVLFLLVVAAASGAEHDGNDQGQGGTAPAGVESATQSHDQSL